MKTWEIYGSVPPDKARIKTVGNIKGLDWNTYPALLGSGSTRSEALADAEAWLSSMLTLVRRQLGKGSH